jgi:hypothetical protein
VFVLGLALIALVSLQSWAANNAAVEQRILGDLKYLASDACEGRGVTTQGINLAADYIAGEFKKAGLKPAGNAGSYFQPFTMVSGSKLAGGPRLLFQGPLGQTIELEMGKDFTVMGFGGSGRVNAPVVFAGHGITSAEDRYDDYQGIDVAGKVVIVLRQVPGQGDPRGPFAAPDGQINRHAQLDIKASNAELHKAAAVLFVNDTVTAAESRDQLRSFSSTAFGSGTVGIPAVQVRRSLVNQMIRSVTGRDLADLEHAIDRELKPHSLALDGWSCTLEVNVERQVTPVKNVVGVLEGSGPLANETIILGAHYDHLGYGGRGSLQPGAKSIHYGADDNASGTAALIELARRFGAVRERQGRRLVFIAFSAEESGLLGSAHYCRQPLYPLESTVAMINMDMVGRLRDNKLTIGGTGTAKEFDSLLDTLNAKYKFTLAKERTGLGPSDHASFYRQKIPVLFFFTGLHPQYHRPTDTVDTINVEGIRQVVDMVEELTTHLSTAPKRPEYVYVPGSFRPGGPGGPRGPRLGFMPANYNEDEVGVLIGEVSEGGPAAKAGLKKDDRIIEIGGKPVRNMTSYMTIMANYRRGDTIEVTVLRDGKRQTVKVVPE